MPQILELRVIDDQLWARIPSMADSVTVKLWTEAEKQDALRSEREACIDAIHSLNRAVDWDIKGKT